MTRYDYGFDAVIIFTIMSLYSVQTQQGMTGMAYTTQPPVYGHLNSLISSVELTCDLYIITISMIRLHAHMLEIALRKRLDVIITFVLVMCRIVLFFINKVVFIVAIWTARFLDGLNDLGQSDKTLNLVLSITPLTVGACIMPVVVVKLFYAKSL